MGLQFLATDPAPRDRKARREYFATHSRHNERVWVVELPNGHYGTLDGRLAVARRAEDLALYADRGEIKSLLLPEGVRVCRV